MQLRTRVIVVALSLLTLFGLAAFTAEAADGDREHIVFWHSMGGRNGEATMAIVDAFNASQDKYFVEAQYQGHYDNALAKLRTTPRNMWPNVMQMYDVATQWMLDTGNHIKVQDFIDVDDVSTDDYHPNILAYYTIDGELHAMPFNSSVPAATYNKEALERAGVDPSELDTLEGMMAASKKIVESGAARHGAVLTNDSWMFEQYLAMMGAHLVDNGNGREGRPTRLVIDENGAGLELLKRWREFSTYEYNVDYGSGGGTGVADAKREFASGNVAILLSTVGLFRDVQEAAAGSFTVAQRPLPKLNEDDPYRLTVGGASLWIMDSGDAAKARGAWEFVKFAASPEQQARWVAATGYLPVSNRATEQDVYKAFLEENPGFASVMESFDEASPEDAGALLAVIPKMRTIIEAEVERLLLDPRYTEEAALKSIVDQVNMEIELYNLTN